MQFLTGSMISVVICVAVFAWMKKTSGEINFRVMRIRSGGSGLQQPSSEEIRIPSNNSQSPRERNSYSVKIRWALDKR